jgi:hypothetical protein
VPNRTLKLNILRRLDRLEEMVSRGDVQARNGPSPLPFNLPSVPAELAQRFLGAHHAHLARRSDSAPGIMDLPLKEAFDAFAFYFDKVPKIKSSA